MFDVTGSIDGKLRRTTMQFLCQFYIVVISHKYIQKQYLDVLVTENDMVGIHYATTKLGVMLVTVGIKD